MLFAPLEWRRSLWGTWTAQINNKTMLTAINNRRRGKITHLEKRQFSQWKWAKAHSVRGFFITVVVVVCCFRCCCRCALKKKSSGFILFSRLVRCICTFWLCIHFNVAFFPLSLLPFLWACVCIRVSFQKDAFISFYVHCKSVAYYP